MALTIIVLTCLFMTWFFVGMFLLFWIFRLQQKHARPEESSKHWRVMMFWDLEKMEPDFWPELLKPLLLLIALTTLCIWFGSRVI